MRFHKFVDIVFASRSFCVDHIAILAIQAEPISRRGVRLSAYSLRLVRCTNPGTVLGKHSFATHKRSHHNLCSHNDSARRTKLSIDRRIRTVPKVIGAGFSIPYIKKGTFRPFLAPKGKYWYFCPIKDLWHRLTRSAETSLAL